MTRTSCAVLVAGLAWIALGPRSAAGQSSEGETRPRALVVVLVGQLNIRATPRLDAPVVGVSLRGDTLCVSDFEADWVGVTRPPGDPELPALEGFVARGLVSEVRATPATIQDLGCG